MRQMPVVLLLAAACGSSSPPPPSPAATHDAVDVAAPDAPKPADTPLARARAIVAAADRSPEDRALDAGRKPDELLELLDLREGNRVAELGAGGGYTAELLARAVGPTGRVWGQNAPFVLERFAEAPWSARLARPIMAPVRRLDTPFDAPFPADFDDAGRLDAVINVLFYHDTVWQGVDRAAMNAAVFNALRPGGRYVIVDHSARPEDGTAVTETLHRIAEDAVHAEVTAAGFQLEGSASFLRVPDDARDWNASPKAAGERRGASDRFVLVFRKPAATAR